MYFWPLGHERSKRCFNNEEMPKAILVMSLLQSLLSRNGCSPSSFIEVSLTLFEIVILIM